MPALAFALVGCGSATAGGLDVSSAATHLPTSKNSHVVVIVMENKENSDVLGNAAAPYLNALVRRYGLATQSFAITHPSLPNYLALTSGSTQGITSDCTSCSVAAPNIVDQLTSAGISWKAYLEDYPHRASRVPAPAATRSGTTRSSTTTTSRSNPARCSHLVGFGALTADLTRGTTADVCVDHAEPLRRHPRLQRRRRRSLPRPYRAVAAARARAARFPRPHVGRRHDERRLLRRRRPRRSYRDGRRRPRRDPGSRERSPVDHYGVLATIERALALPLLGGAADARSGQLDYVVHTAAAHPVIGEFGLGTIAPRSNGPRARLPR